MLLHEPEAHNEGRSESDALNSSSASNIPEDWWIDLHRLVQQHEASCMAAEPEDFRISIYTWFLDHREQLVCFHPRIVYLRGFPAEWEDDILFVWRHVIAPNEKTFIDVVTPKPPESDLEDHVAHIILTQRPTDKSSVLFSLDFEDPDGQDRSVLVRFALAVPRQSTRHDLFALLPHFASLHASRLQWIEPSLSGVDQILTTRNGMGILMRVQPDERTEDTQPLTDITNLLQQREITFQKKSLPIERDTTNLSLGHPNSCSFTTEFLEAIAAHEEATRMEPLLHPAPDPRTIEAQHGYIQELWERLTDIQASTLGGPMRAHRVESWFLDHGAFTRCHSSRITLLSDDFLSWHQAFIQTWRDKISDNANLGLVLVHPLPEDAAVGIIGQVIITQNAVHELRSAVLSVYDSDPDTERSPHTFALVLSEQLSLSNLLVRLNLVQDCNLPDRRNHCSLWFGRIPISATSVVNVHMGSAFRLVISRGAAIDITQLLSMSNAQLRTTLQRSMQSEIFIRPPDPAFLSHEDMQVANIDTETSGDVRPEWILTLQRHFNDYYVVDDIEEGEALQVQVWYLNEHPDFHCSQSRPVRLLSDVLAWRTDLIFPWRDRFVRATPFDLFVLPVALDRSEISSRSIHTLVTQGLPTGSCAVVITLQANAHLGLRWRRFAHVFLTRVAVRDILRLVVPDEHAHRAAYVQYNGLTFLPGEYLLLQSGRAIEVVISEQNIDLFTDQIADGFSLFQQFGRVTKETIFCKPAPFEEPDDLAMILPRPNLPPPTLPRHDGEIEWSLQLGEILHQHGDLNYWDDSRSLMVITWFVHHTLRPVCLESRVIQLFGHAVTWIEDLRNAWADALDPLLPFSIHIVVPRPSQIRMQRATCHILLEQNKPDHRAGLVLTASIEGTANDGIMQGAYSVPTRLQLQDVIDTMGIAQHCINRPCSLLRGRQLLPTHDLTEVNTGQSLRVRIGLPAPQPAEQIVDELPFDALALMQCFQFNPNAPSFVPGTLNIVSQPEWTQDLYQLWGTSAVENDGVRVANFLTWFVSPANGRMRCLYSRQVSLVEDFSSWERVLRQAWIDLLDPTVAVEFVVVVPQPEQMEPMIAGHVVLVQHAIETMSSPLVTISDVAIHQGKPFRVVIAVNENARSRDFLQGVGYDRNCYLEAAQCQLRHGTLAISEGRVIPVRDGDCIYVQITRPFLPSDWTPPIVPFPPGVEGQSFLQIHSQLKHRKSPKQHRESNPNPVQLVTWYVDQERPICRSFRCVLVSSNDCLAKCAEELWDDVLKGQTCHMYAVDTMCKVMPNVEHEEICFLLSREPQSNAAVVLLEPALDTGREVAVEHVGIFAADNAPLQSLWTHLQGRPGS